MLSMLLGSTFSFYLLLLLRILLLNPTLFNDELFGSQEEISVS